MVTTVIGSTTDFFDQLPDILAEQYSAPLDTRTLEEQLQFHGLNPEEFLFTSKRTFAGDIPSKRIRREGKEAQNFLLRILEREPGTTVAQLYSEMQLAGHEMPIDRVKAFLRATVTRSKISCCVFKQLVQGFRRRGRRFRPDRSVINRVCGWGSQHTNDDLRRWLEVVLFVDELPVFAAKLVETTPEQFQRLVKKLRTEVYSEVY